MYKHLTKGEKKKKLRQARKRAIVWSAQEQLRKALKIQSTSESESTESKKLAAKSPPTGSQTASASRSLLTPTAQSQNQYTTVPTIAEIEATLQSLYQQRQQLNTTIAVLQQQLLHLHSKEDEDYEFN